MSRLVARAFGGALLALAALLPVRARAQQQPAPVPARLVAALLDLPESAHVVVDRVPDGFPAELRPPAPATPVGGISGRRTSTAIFAFPGPEAETAKSYASLVTRAGWKLEERHPEHEGFVHYVGEMATVYCRDSSRLAFRRVRGATAGSWLRVEVHPGPRDQECGKPWRPDPGEYPLRLPRLVPPDGARTVGGSSGSGSDGMTSSTRLVIPMGAADLAAHYAAQLSAAGWTVGAPLAGPMLATRALTTRDTKGAEWRGTLTVVELAGSRHVAIAMMRTEHDEPWR